MFMARPINLKTEVWDRIDEYLNKKADEDRNFKPNRSLFLEEAAIAFLDAAENPPAEEEASEETSEESFDFGSSDEEPPAKRAAKKARTKKVPKTARKRAARKAATTSTLTLTSKAPVQKARQPKPPQKKP